MVVSARRLHAQEHDAVLGALGPALEGGAAPQGAGSGANARLTPAAPRAHLLFRARFHDFCRGDNKHVTGAFFRPAAAAGRPRLPVCSWTFLLLNFRKMAAALATRMTGKAIHHSRLSEAEIGGSSTRARRHSNAPPADVGVR